MAEQIPQGEPYKKDGEWFCDMHNRRFRLRYKDDDFGLQYPCWVFDCLIDKEGKPVPMIEP